MLWLYLLAESIAFLDLTVAFATFASLGRYVMSASASHLISVCRVTLWLNVSHVNMHIYVSIAHWGRTRVRCSQLTDRCVSAGRWSSHATCLLICLLLMLSCARVTRLYQYVVFCTFVVTNPDKLKLQQPAPRHTNARSHTHAAAGTP
jgi:hypothetical protein